MKTKIFLGMGLLLTAIGFGQTTTIVNPGVTDGNSNIVIGTALPSSSLGVKNVSIGFSSGISTTIGTSNVFCGFEAGKNNVDGSHNVFSGANSGSGNISGGQNSYVGCFAGQVNNSSQNVFVGFKSGQYNSGSHNTFSGWQAGIGISTQNNPYNNNSFFGSEAGSSSSGSNNTFIGRGSGASSAGSNNAFVGVSAGNTAGDRNAGIGQGAGQGLDGMDNVFVGYRAGAGSQGDGNVLIGAQVGAAATGNQLYIDNFSTSNPLIYGDFTANQLKFNANKVGIGPDFGGFTTNLPNDNIYRLYVRGGILAEEVRIRLQADWADYVFAKDYKLLSLKDTERYISDNGHLPNMPSAEKVKAEGIELGNIVTLQQEKIEELTLHLIKQEKQIEELKAQVELILKSK